MSAVFNYMNSVVAAGLAYPARAGPMLRLKINKKDEYREVHEMYGYMYLVYVVLAGRTHAMRSRVKQSREPRQFFHHRKYCNSLEFDALLLWQSTFVPQSPFPSRKGNWDPRRGAFEQNGVNNSVDFNVM